MRKKSILLIIAIVAITYAIFLFNDFVGDDHMLFVQSDFFKSWNHFPELFTPAAVTNVNDLYFDYEGKTRSGVVSYRPVVMATYFLEYQIWRLNPFGYHLNNLFIHILNAILVFIVILNIAKSERIALLGALLFSVHPINAEAVCNIGRADILACFFGLVSFLCFIRYTEFRGPRRAAVLSVSLMSFFLAVFTKESAIVWPVIMIAYDFFIKEKSGKTIWKDLRSRYLGFGLISIFYLYVYFFIFPNPVLWRMAFFGADLLTHLVTMMKIIKDYTIAFLWPFSISILPTMYTPPVHPLWSHENIWSFCFLLLCFLVGAKIFARSKILAFAVAWLGLAFLPVANIFPLANPMAYRFMYLPSIGFAMMAAVLLEQSFLMSRHPGFRTIFTRSLIGICVILTIFLNSSWRNNYTMATTILKNCPESTKAYQMLAFYFQEKRLYPQAREQLQKALLIEPDNPVLYHDLGALYVNDPQKAIDHFKKAIEIYPGYKRAYTDLCRAYANKEDYPMAMVCFEERIADGDIGIGTYVDYTRLCLLAQEREKAKAAYSKALARYPNNVELLDMEQLLVGGKP